MSSERHVLLQREEQIRKEVMELEKALADLREEKSNQSAALLCLSVY